MDISIEIEGIERFPITRAAVDEVRHEAAAVDVNDTEAFVGALVMPLVRALIRLEGPQAGDGLGDDAAVDEDPDGRA